MLYHTPLAKIFVNNCTRIVTCQRTSGVLTSKLADCSQNELYPDYIEWINPSPEKKFNWQRYNDHVILHRGTLFFGYRRILTYYWSNHVQSLRAPSAPQRSHSLFIINYPFVSYVLQRLKLTNSNIFVVMVTRLINILAVYIANAYQYCKLKNQFSVT